MWTVAQGCSSPVPPDITASDPLLTQNAKKAGRTGRKQRKIRRANGGKKHKSEPKRLRFVLETTYGKVLSGQDEIETFLAYLRGDRSGSSPWRYPDDEFVQQPAA